MVVSAPPILIWGAGAIGGSIGACLARAGQDVLFVDSDAAHVAAMNANGLKITGPVEEYCVPARASLPGAVTGTFDRVLLCVKAHHTPAAMAMLAPHLAEDGYVASFQNGLNELVIAECVGRARTIGAFVNFGADYLEPGVVHFGGRGAFVLGELDGSQTLRLRDLHRLAQVFEPKAEMTDNILGYLWGKLGYGALLFATALTNASICEALEARGPRALYRALAGEAVAVALSQGIAPIGFNGYHPEAFAPHAAAALADASFAEMVAHNARSAKTHSGIWRDLAVRKRVTEVDAQLGPVVAFGRERKIATPVTQRLIAMIHEVETGARPLHWDNLADLDTARLAG